MRAPTFIETERLVLTALHKDDMSEDYLRWLNDPGVLRYRSGKAWPTTTEELYAFLHGVALRDDLVLAIRTRDGQRHIGNLALNSIQWVHGTAELSILIGAKDVWGMGFGKEAIAGVTAHAFSNMRLLRLWAESPNPAFNALIRRLGWVHEGTKRKAFLLDSQHVDVECWGLLSGEWHAGAALARRSD